MSDAIFAFLSDLPLNWIVFFASAIPVTELRAAIPFGIAMGMPPLSAMLWGFLGNLLPIPFILLLWPLIYKLFDRFAFTRKFLHRYIDKAREKGRTIEKKGAIGLTLFVGVPLPVTGVWTGSLISYLLGLNPLYAVLSLAGGAAIAAVVVTLVTVGVISAGNTIGWWWVILIAAVLIAAIVLLVRRRKQG